MKDAVPTSCSHFGSIGSNIGKYRRLDSISRLGNAARVHLFPVANRLAVICKSFAAAYRTPAVHA